MMHRLCKSLCFLLAACCWQSMFAQARLSADDFKATENDENITLDTPLLEAVVSKRNYVTGIKGGSFLDKRTGFRDVGYGLDIVDWLMEPGSDEAYRDKLPKHMIYEYGNAVHGKSPKRSIEGPQICTQAKRLEPEVIQGKNFIAVKQTYRYNLAAPGKKVGSTWTQYTVFPPGERFFISSDRVDVVNDSPNLFLRIDMPGHIKHQAGDTFSEVYLSYRKDLIPASEFSSNFAPDEKFHYSRNDDEVPARFIRAYHLRDPKTGKAGPWLAGMTLHSELVSEAWCHQRGYVCLIEEIGGRPVKAGDSFGAAYVVGFFDTIEEMHDVYDRYAGHTGLRVNKDGWKMLAAGDEDLDN